MKARESGMPPEGTWNAFFKPAEALATLGIDRGVKDVADFGCGYGTFAIPAAKAVSGTVYAIDFEEEMTSATAKKAAENGMHNVKALRRDLFTEGSGLPKNSVDFVLLFNILHAERPETLLNEAHRILRPKGRIAIMHWIPDARTPRGPPMEIRPTPEQCIGWALKAGFAFPKQFDLKPFHYGIVMEKLDS